MSDTELPRGDAEPSEHLHTLARMETAEVAVNDGLAIALAGDERCSVSVVVVPGRGAHRRYAVSIGDRPEVYSFGDACPSLAVSRDPVHGAAWHDEDPAFLLQVIGDEIAVTGLAENDVTTVAGLRI